MNQTNIIGDNNRQNEMRDSSPEGVEKGGKRKKEGDEQEKPEDAQGGKRRKTIPINTFLWIPQEEYNRAGGMEMEGVTRLSGEGMRESEGKGRKEAKEKRKRGRPEGSRGLERREREEGRKGEREGEGEKMMELAWLSSSSASSPGFSPQASPRLEVIEGSYWEEEEEIRRSEEQSEEDLEMEIPILWDVAKEEPSLSDTSEFYCCASPSSSSTFLHLFDEQLSPV